VAEYVLNAGVLEIAGTFSANQQTNGGTNFFLFNGGTLAAGTFNPTNLWETPGNALVNLGGTLAPGGTGMPGRTVIQGSYVCSNATVLALDLAGTNPAISFTNPGAYYDTVGVAGQAVLNGSLAVSLLNGYVPAATNSFVVLTNGGPLAGAFTNLANGRVAVVNYAGGSFLVATSATSVVLTNFQVLLAQFTPSVTVGTSPLAVVFTNTSLGSITNANWNFGDGATTNTQAGTVTHIYTTAGTNTVSLAISGPAGTNVAQAIIGVTAAVPAAAPVIGSVSLVGTNLILTGTNGTAGEGCVILSTTNLLLPLTNWTALATNSFNQAGQAGFTNPVNRRLPAVYYRLWMH